MAEENFYDRKEREAAEKVAALLRRRMPENSDDVGIPSRPDGSFHEEDAAFDPWDMFPIYGSYSGDFDECAIDVLQGMLDRNREHRADLAANMFREMLCIMGLCNYGTSPRYCFPSTRFREMLPELVEKWRAYSKIMWQEA